MRIQDVAKQLNVSVATISRALNPATAPLVAPKTRRRVEEYVSRVGYIPNRTARELSTGKTRTLGLILPNVLESIFFNDYLIKVLGGVTRTLERHPHYNCKIVILPKGADLKRLDQYVLTTGVDGLLLSPYCDLSLYTPPFPKAIFSSWRIPIVMLNLKVENAKNISCVYTDNFEGARKATTYLIGRGHQSIGFIGGPSDYPETRQRLDGYHRALEDHGFPLKPEWEKKGHFIIEGGYDATLALFRGAPVKPTALFCANDEMGIGAIRALKALGIRCPQDVAVMGFDGIDLGAYVEPPLTSMRQPTSEIAERSTEILLDLLEKRLSSPVQLSLAGDLLVRESA